MLNWLRKGKSLFNCDREYLEEKLSLVPPRYKKHRPEPLKFTLPHRTDELLEPIPEEILFPKTFKKEQPISSETIEKLKISSQKIIQLEKELTESKTTITSLKTTIEQQSREIEIKDAEILKLTSKFKKIISDPSFEGLDLEELKKKILDETQKIDNQKVLSEQIKKQKEKLEQLISYREEYENRVTKEKEELEKKIKIENQSL